MNNMSSTQYTNITPQELDEILTKNTLLIDVREKSEFIVNHISKANLIPLSEFSLDLIIDIINKNKKKINTNQPINLVFYCKSGKRSLSAIHHLLEENLDTCPYQFVIYNLQKGILGYLLSQ